MDKIISTLSLLISRTDEDAMWEVKTHDDHREFARLVKRWEEPIRRLCARMSGDAHRAEDLKQEIFARLYDRRKDYQPTGRFSTYLWRIALNFCYDDLRRTKRRQALAPEGEAAEIEERPAEAATPDWHAASREEGELVRRALQQLPETYRAVIVLRHYENLKLSKIAEILDIPEGTVNSRMAEALARLSHLLEPALAGKSALVPRPPPSKSREVFIV